MRENFLNGASSPYEYLKELESSNMPQLMKDSFGMSFLILSKKLKKHQKHEY